MKKLTATIFFMAVFIGCGVDRDAEIVNLKVNLDQYNQLRVYLEGKYKVRLSDPSRPRIVFKKCEDFERSNRDFVCDDIEVLKKMKALSIKDISFERKKCNNYHFSEIHFQMSQAGEYPVIYYLYERCGAGDAFESGNIFYEPVSDYWGLYIDSSFP